MLHDLLFWEKEKKKRSSKCITCGVVNFPEMVPMTASISQAYSSVSVSSDSPSWENMACPRTCRPERARWPSLRCSWSPSLCTQTKTNKKAPISISIQDTAVGMQNSHISGVPDLPPSAHRPKNKSTYQHQRYSSGKAKQPSLVFLFSPPLPPPHLPCAQVARKMKKYFHR